MNVSVQTVDGGLHETRYAPEFLVRLLRLRSEGIEGKALIDELLGDDWGAPPVLVTITGTDPEGQRVNIRIPYE